MNYKELEKKYSYLVDKYEGDNPKYIKRPMKIEGQSLKRLLLYKRDKKWEQKNTKVNMNENITEDNLAP